MLYPELPDDNIYCMPPADGWPEYVNLEFGTYVFAVITNQNDWDQP